MKIMLVLNTLLFCGAILLVAACSQDGTLQACGSDKNCPSTQYCAMSGGVFFATAHCVDRGSNKTLEPEAESGDVAPNSGDADTENGVDTENELPKTCDSVCPGELPVCNSVRDQCVVFVSANGSDDDNSGLQPDAPVATLTHALAVAVEQKRRYVMVTEGDFEERVELENGISIYGGYALGGGWARDLDLYRTNILGEPSALDIESRNLKTVVGENLTERTVLDGLTIHGQDTTSPSTSTFGLWAVHSDNLVLNNMIILAGIAGNGSDGVGGTDGNATGCIHFRGGSGGVSPSDFRPCTDLPAASQSGSAGTGIVVAGQYGEGGRGGQGICSFAGQKSGTAEAGFSGLPGKPGLPGIDGVPASASGRFEGDGQWVILGGSHPGDGLPGSGGGGGGAGGYFQVTGSIPRNLVGANGMDGNNGACGGGAGQNGESGGSSVGVAIVSGRIVARNTTIVLGNGGDGGKGGRGGKGGLGMPGASGAAGQCYKISCGGAGGNGGDGGDGGRGGHGAGGHGGDAIGMFIADSNVDTDATVEFDTLLSVGGRAGKSHSLDDTARFGKISETVDSGSSDSE